MKLKERRLNSNLKIKGICDCLGISRSTYYLMETGKRKVTDEEKEKLDKLFRGVEDERNN